MQGDVVCSDNPICAVCTNFYELQVLNSCLGTDVSIVVSLWSLRIYGFNISPTRAVLAYRYRQVLRDTQKYLQY